jgi:hypothetical protein
MIFRWFFKETFDDFSIICLWNFRWLVYETFDDFSMICLWNFRWFFDDLSMKLSMIFRWFVNETFDNFSMICLWNFRWFFIKLSMIFRSFFKLKIALIREDWLTVRQNSRNRYYKKLPSGVIGFRCFNFNEASLFVIVINSE